MALRVCAHTLPFSHARPVSTTSRGHAVRTNWVEHVDPRSGEVQYYVDSISGEVCWELPADTTTASLHAAGPETLSKSPTVPNHRCVAAVPSRDLLRSRKEAEEWTTNSELRRRHNNEGRHQQLEKLTSPCTSRRAATASASVGAHSPNSCSDGQRPRVPSNAEQLLPSPSHHGSGVRMERERPRTAGAAVISTSRRQQPRQSSRADGDGSTAHHAQPRGRATHSAPRMRQSSKKSRARKTRGQRNDSINRPSTAPSPSIGSFPYANSMARDNDRVPRSARDAVRLLRRIRDTQNTVQTPLRHMKGHDGSKLTSMLTDAAARGKATAGGTEKNSSRNRPRSRGAARTGAVGDNEGTSPATGKGHASPHSASGRPPFRPLLRPGSRANWEKKRDAIVEIMAAFQYDISYDKM